MPPRDRSKPVRTPHRTRGIPPVRRLVVKIGSAALADDGRLRLPTLHRLATDIAGAIDAGVEVIVVTSGAVASGFRLLGLERRPSTIVEKQAAAAVGQSRLMQAWADAFHVHSRVVAQALLTADDLSHPVRLENARSTLLALTARGVTPIINENDTVSFDEIKLGDNDRLSALVATLVKADLLLILSTVSGLYAEGDARRLIPVVPDAGAALAHVQEGTTGVGTGGMATKLQAAAIATREGVAVVVASATEPSVVARMLAGEALGTYFPPHAKGAGRGGATRRAATNAVARGAAKQTQGARAERRSGRERRANGSGGAKGSGGSS